MPIPSIKSDEAISAMRDGGKILGRILFELKNTVKQGITTKSLDFQAETLMAKFNVIPSFKNYKGYPASICTNVNNQVVHGIPDNYVLKQGDIISIDAGLIHKGWHVDAAAATGVGQISDADEKFIKTAYIALEEGIKAAQAGMRTGDIGFAIQQAVMREGYSAVHDFTGHGIGKNLHEPPEVPNFGQKGKGTLLVPGMTICIEPIIAIGKRYCDILSDGWTAVTRDESLAVQVEHTILITPVGPEILTLYTEG